MRFSAGYPSVELTFFTRLGAAGRAPDRHGSVPLGWHSLTVSSYVPQEDGQF